MQRALELAARGIGCTSPNPLVGCVIVSDGQIIGEGWHEQYGKCHAEVNALNAVHREKTTHHCPTVSNTNSRALGATLYVTLEPCNHQGLTPPCTQAILTAGIEHVVFALADPNPLAAGGAAWLVSKGVTVTGGVLEARACEQNRFFLKHVATHLPYVIAKSATSLDGRIATRSGHSQWITGPEARTRGHLLRQAVDAIVVGADTVISDNPSLTVRLPESICSPDAKRDPRPVILDSTGRVPLHVKLLDGSLPTRTIIITSNQMSTSHRGTLESRGYDVITVVNNTHGIGLDPILILEALGQRGIQSILIEGGASVHGTFRDANLIDEVWTFLAPTIIGGKDAPAAFSALGSDKLVDATQLEGVQIETVGRDILIRARVMHAHGNNQNQPVIPNLGHRYDNEHTSSPLWDSS